MAWLYLPVSVGLNSVSSNCSLNRESFVMSRGKPMQAQSLYRKWKKDSFMKLLYGLMLEPSTAQSLVERWISLLPDSHVNPGRLLENYRKPMTKDGFGMILKESFAKLDPHSSSWKTSQVSLMGELTPFLGRWPRSGSMLNGVVSRCPKLAETITEKEFLFSDIYPTPTASQITTEGTTRLYRNLFLNGILTLEEATAMNGNYNPLKKKGALEIFPTPTAHEAEKAGFYSKGQMGQSLSAMAKQGRIYNTPVARDGANSTFPPSQSKWDSLPGDIMRMGEARPGGVLNPEFVEWLMGWPIGWTDLEPAVMESSLIKRIEHLLNSSQEQLKGVN